VTDSQDLDFGADVRPEDKLGFAVPVTPGHSLMLLNHYMRTDMLLNIHQSLHRMRDANMAGSPLQHLAKSLEWVVDNYDGLNLFECFARNLHHIKPDFEFRPEQDYLHDIRLMRHHLKCHRKTMKDIKRFG
jgi:hypothetical protein